MDVAGTHSPRQHQHHQHQQHQQHQYTPRNSSSLRTASNNSGEYYEEASHNYYGNNSNEGYYDTTGTTGASGEAAPHHQTQQAWGGEASHWEDYGANGANGAGSSVDNWGSSIHHMSEIDGSAVQASSSEWVQDETTLEWCKMVGQVAWKVEYTEEDHPYYVNTITGESQWEEPGLEYDPT